MKPCRLLAWVSIKIVQISTKTYAHFLRPVKDGSDLRVLVVHYPIFKWEGVQ